MGKKIIPTSLAINYAAITACTQVMLLKGIIADCSDNCIKNVHRVYVLYPESIFFVC